MFSTESKMPYAELKENWGNNSMIYWNASREAFIYSLGFQFRETHNARKTTLVIAS